MTLQRLAVATYFPRDPEKPSGGVEAVSVNLVRALAARREFSVDVVTLDASIDAPTRGEWAGARLHRLPRGTGSELGTALGQGRASVQRYLLGLAPDVVHAHDTFGIMVQGLALPRVFTIHGFIHGDTLVSGRKFARLRSLLWKRYETAAWADQPHIISISPYVRERLTGIARGVIHDIDNPISEPFFSIERRERPGAIFCAAAICPRKNQLALVEAVARLAKRGVDAELRLAGPVTDAGYGQQVAEAIRRHGIGERVKMLGQIGTPSVMQELQGAAVFALVSLEENSPMGIEEAMAARVPVLTSNRCGMPYMVRSGETGYLVDPHDIADIETRLARLLGDPALRAAMGARAHEVARSRFHPDYVAGRTAEVYRDCLERAGQDCR
jgi:glycosyltransferase involved in cell wall biosynthesis